MIITVTFILFILGLFFWSFLPYISIFSERKKQKLFRQLSKEGTRNALVFCSQELLDNIIIGFDGIHRKILVIERSNKKYTSSIISLDEVQHCQLVTKEGVFEAGNFKKLNQQINIGILELKFEFSNHHESASIIFNKGLTRSKREFVLLKAKAEYWCVMFSKMLNHRVSVRA